MKELIAIQQRLKSPKNKVNTYSPSKFKYRSYADIVASLKPLLADLDCFVTCCEDIVLVAHRIYIKSTATLTNSDNVSISSTSYAREAEERKSFDPSQLTGSCTSYARKYALVGLFAIDDDLADDVDAGVPALSSSVNERGFDKKGAFKGQDEEPSLPPPKIISKITELQLSNLKQKLDKFRVSQQKICELGNVDSLEQLTQDRLGPLNTYITTNFG